jgi:hypothetical protein
MATEKSSTPEQEPITPEIRIAWIRLLARAVSDKSFRELLQHDLGQALADYGIRASQPEELVKQLTPSLAEALGLVDVVGDQPQAGAAPQSPTFCGFAAPCFAPAFGQSLGTSGTFGTVGSFGGTLASVGSLGCLAAAHCSGPLTAMGPANGTTGSVAALQSSGRVGLASAGVAGGLCRHDRHNHLRRGTRSAKRSFHRLLLQLRQSLLPVKRLVCKSSLHRLHMWYRNGGGRPGRARTAGIGGK